jgi:hypothetical protein
MILYALPNGKSVYITVEEFLNLTDSEIQFLVSINYGESILDPFYGSAVQQNSEEKYYDFDYLPNDEDDIDNIASDDEPFDDIIDLGLSDM